MNKIDSRFIEFDTSDPNAVTGDDISISTTNSDKLDTPGTVFSQQDGAPTLMAQDSTAVVTHPSLNGIEGHAVFQVLELAEGLTQNTTDIIAYADKDKWNYENVQGTVAQLNSLQGGLDSYTKLLLHGDTSGDWDLDSSGNNHTMGSSSAFAYSTTDPQLGSGCMYTTGGWVDTDNHADYHFGDTDEFTIDFWWKHTGDGGHNGTFWVATGGTIYMSYSAGTNIIGFSFNSTNASTSAAEGAIIKNGSWHHIACVRRNNAGTYQHTIFIDGEQIAAGWTTQNTGVAGTTAVLTFCGYLSHLTQYSVHGYLDELRVSKGIARWTSNFDTELPTAPYCVDGGRFETAGDAAVSIGTIPEDTDTKLLIHSDTTNNSQVFNDSSLSNHTVSYNNQTKHSTAISPPTGMGSSSIYFDGSNDTLSVPASNDWNFGTGDFTIDFWVNRTVDGAETGYGIMQNTGATGGNDYEYLRIGFYHEMIQFRLRDGSSGNEVTAFTPNLSLNTWYHIACVRASGICRIYYNGIPGASVTSSNDFQFGTTEGLTFGQLRTGAWHTGYLDEIRISKGVARWTKDFSTELPSAPYSIAAIEGTEPKIQAGCQFKLDSDSTIYTIQEIDGVGTDVDALTITPTGAASADVDWVRGNNIPETGTNADKLSLVGTTDNMSDYVLYMPLDTANGKTDLSDGSHGTANDTGTPTIVTEIADPFGGNRGVLKCDPGDNLYFSDSDDWSPSGDWTLDCWVKFTADVIGALFLFLHRADATNIFSHFINPEPGGDLPKSWILSEAAGAGARILSVTSIADPWLDTNQWYHFTSIRSGSNVGVYIDGIQISHGLYSPAVPNIVADLVLCWQHPSAITPAYYSNVRFANSNNIFNANPTSALADTIEVPTIASYPTNQYYTATTNDSGQVDISTWSDLNYGEIDEEVKTIGLEIDTTDTYTTLGHDGSSTYYDHYQGFILGGNRVINKVALQLAENVGSPTGTVTVRIETDNSGVPSGTLADVNAELASVTPVPSSWNEFEFATPFELSAGIYHIVCTVTSQTGGNRFNIYHSSSSVMAGVNGGYKENGGAWYSASTRDLSFRVYFDLNNNYYSISTDARDSYKVFNQTESVWRDIARNNSGTWQYNNATDATAETWVDSDINSSQSAISQAVETQAANRMIGSEYEAITDEEWNDPNGWVSSQTTLDLAVTQTTNSSITPIVDDFTANYDIDGAYQLQRIIDDYDVVRLSDTTTKFTKVSAGTAGSVYCTVIV